MASFKQIVCLDESGNTSLPQSTAPDCYVIAALLANPEKRGVAEKRAAEIVNKHAGGGELKSSNIGNNFRRRMAVLNDIANAGFNYCCLTIDKQLISRDCGLRFKNSFYKYFHRQFLHKLIYGRIKRLHYEVELIADRHGSTDFMKRFLQYIESEKNLFDSFIYVPASENPTLQIADVVAGSIRRVYLNQDPPDFLKIIKELPHSIEEWPPDYKKHGDLTAELPERRFDVLIRRVALTSARGFIEKNLESSNRDNYIQAEAIRYLLLRFYDDPKKYVLRAEISRHLKNIGFTAKERILSTQILAKAKEAEVIIVSTENGIKLPYDAEDINDWVKRVDVQVVPYLSRLELARSILLRESGNEYDIVAEGKFTDLALYLKKEIS